MNEIITNFINQEYDRMLDTLRELCQIPAPSHHEEQRAAYCKAWLESIGAQNVVIDEAKNVLFGINCEGSRDITAIAAHTDVVFPDTTPLPMHEDEEKIHCPGVGDDTASVVVLMTLAKFFIEHRIAPKNGILFVCNSCEEGLGNLKGTRQLFKDYAGRIGRFITFDSEPDILNDRCVGSHRYKVEAFTEGGHSYFAFGNTNAIAALANMVSNIYSLDVPQKAGTRTSYNVGTIEGGTSVNTIAQHAEMLCEYRSDDVECLQMMQTAFETIFTSANSDKVEIKITRVGDRPCGNVDEKAQTAFVKRVTDVIEPIIGKALTFKSSSTDCNIPLSLGVPAVCIGVNASAGAHTREEWVNKASLHTGLEIAIKTALEVTK
jgi:acetylornithine deacetylase/succinyl-diaminopimelate desuccinylase-like protein